MLRVALGWASVVAKASEPETNLSSSILGAEIEWSGLQLQLQLSRREVWRMWAGTMLTTLSLPLSSCVPQLQAFA